MKDEEEKAGDEEGEEEAETAPAPAPQPARGAPPAFILIDWLIRGSRKPQPAGYQPTKGHPCQERQPREAQRRAHLAPTPPANSSARQTQRTLTSARL